MKKILGLDLGTTSIGWALVEVDDNGNVIKIIKLGSRILPLSAEASKFEQGQAQTKNAERRIARGTRKLNKRYKQRRNKLIFILQRMNMLPDYIQLVSEFTDPNKIDSILIKPIKKKHKQLNALQLYQLRVKALTEKVSLKELGRLFYLYNQLRGYSGGNAEPEKEQESDENENEKQKKNNSFVSLAKIISVSEPEMVNFKGKDLKKYKVTIEIDDENIEETIIEGESYLDILKEGEIIELLINITKNTTIFKLPNKTNWRKKMENLEKELKDRAKIQNREVYISEYFLELLTENKWIKIRDNVVLRSRYESEFKKIWDTQYEKNEEFRTLVDNKDLLNELLDFVFPERPANKPVSEQSILSKKEKYRSLAREHGLEYLIKDQIIYYQRELKDQSDLISTCRYEAPDKVIAKSHPVFQEYRIWEQINKLTINTKTEKGRTKKGDIKYEYIDRPIPSGLKEWLFEELQDKKEISFNPIFNKLKKEYGLREKIDFLNGINPKSKLSGNVTKQTLKKALGVEIWEELNLEDIKNQIQLWDILYNGKGNEYDLTSDRTSRIVELLKNAGINDNIDDIAVSISKIKFSRTYSNLSQKAVEKILPLVRAGKYFDNNFAEELNSKILKLYNENVTDPFEKSAQEYLQNNIEYLSEGGIVNAIATIIVYDNHTAKKYSQEELLQDFNQIKQLKQGELRNPLVEQLVNETLFVVKDIWSQFDGKPDEIRLELSRDLKNNAERRNKIFKNNQSNKKENDRIKEQLTESKIELTNANIEKYKLWASQENLEGKFIKAYKDPSKSEIEKMKLWKEQGHVSPYTGRPIPFSALFDKGQYDKDHIIPQSRYFDDSFTNKVIAETAVNNEKGNRTAMQYFEIGSTAHTILSKEDFIDHVNKTFSGAKRKNLLVTKIPDDPIVRQIKETQYIAVKVKEELGKFVGTANVKSSTGGVTDYLRNQWGLTDIFKELLLPRHNTLLSNDKFLEKEYDEYKKSHEAKKKKYKEQNIEFNEVELSKDNFIEFFKQNYIHTKNNKTIIKDWSKRIDHRHHAIDALVVACTSQAHIQRLNNLNKELQTWLDSNRKELLPEFEGSPSELLEEILYLEKEKRDKIFGQIENFKKVDLPWIGFPEEAKHKIEEIIVSHKPKDKLLIQKNKSDGILQMKIRGQLHDGTLYGKTNNAECYRIPLMKFANKNFATEKTIDKIVNPILKRYISEHLESYNGKKEEAFSAEGILELNNKLAAKTDAKGNAKPHTPIKSIKIYYKNQDEDFDLKKLGAKRADNNLLNDVLSRLVDQSLKEPIVSHIDNKEGDLKKAFSESGLADFNKELEKLLNEKYPGKKFKPLKKIKLQVDQSKEDKEENENEGNISLTPLQREKAFNDKLYVKTNDNYLFAILEKDGKRIYDIVSFFEATNELKKAFNECSDKKQFDKKQVFKEFFEKKNEAKLLFTLKQNDLVYVPDEGEEPVFDSQNENFKQYWSAKERVKNIYVVQKYSKKQIYFLRHSIAIPIANKIELGSQNCYEKIGTRSIKDYCFPISVNRLGQIVKIGE